MKMGFFVSYTVIATVSRWLTVPTYWWKFLDPWNQGPTKIGIGHAIYFDKVFLPLIWGNCRLPWWNKNLPCSSMKKRVPKVRVWFQQNTTWICGRRRCGLHHVFPAYKMYFVNFTECLKVFRLRHQVFWQSDFSCFRNIRGVKTVKTIF